MAQPNDKEKILLARTANAKAKLAKLKAKRIQVCGKLVVNAGLDQFSTETLKGEWLPWLWGVCHTGLEKLKV